MVMYQRCRDSKKIVILNLLDVGKLKIVPNIYKSGQIATFADNCVCMQNARIPICWWLIKKIYRFIY